MFVFDIMATLQNNLSDGWSGIQNVHRDTYIHMQNAVEVIAFSVHKLLSLRIHTIHTYISTHTGGLFIMAFCALKIIYLFPSLLRLKGIPNKRASLWLDGWDALETYVRSFKLC